MSVISHPPASVAGETRPWTEHFFVREMWASLAITVMWIAVAVSAIWGPDFVSTSSGGNETIIPSGIGVAIFASIGTWAIAKYAFGRRKSE